MAESDSSSLQSYTDTTSDSNVSDGPILNLLEQAGTARFEPLKKHRQGLFQTPKIKFPSRSLIEEALHSKSKYNPASISSTPLPNWRRPLAVPSDEFSPINGESYKNGISNLQNKRETKKSNKSYLLHNKASNRSKLDNLSVLPIRIENASIRENISIRRNGSYTSNDAVNSGELLENSSDSDRNNEQALTKQHQSIKPNSFKASNSRNSKREISSVDVNNFLKRNISKSINSFSSTKPTGPSRKSLNACVNDLHEKKNMEVQTSLSQYLPANLSASTSHLERNLFLSLQNGHLIESMDSDANYNVLGRPSNEVAWRIPSTSGHNNTTSLCYDKASKGSNKNRYCNDKKNLKVYRNFRRNYKQKDLVPSKSITELSDFHRSKCKKSNVFSNNPDQETDNSSTYDDEDFIPNKTSKSTSKLGTTDKSVLKQSILSSNNGQDHEMENPSTDEEVNDILNANMLPKSTSKLTNGRKSGHKESKHSNNDSEMENYSHGGRSVREKTYFINNDPDQEMESCPVDEDFNVNADPKSTSKISSGRRSVHEKTNLTNNVIHQEIENLNTNDVDKEYSNVNAVPKSTSKLTNGRKSVYKEGRHTNNDSEIKTYSDGRRSVREKTDLTNNVLQQEIENLNTNEDDNEYSNVNAVPKSTPKRRISKKSLQKQSKVSINDKEPDSLNYESAHHSKQNVSILEKRKTSSLETLCEKENEQLEIAGPSKTTSKKLKQAKVRKTFDGINLALPDLTNTSGRPVRNRRPPPPKVYDNIFQFVCSGRTFRHVNLLKEDERDLFKKPDVKKGNKGKPKKSVTKTKTNKMKSKSIFDETTEDESPNTPKNDLDSGVVEHYDTNDAMTTNLQANEETDFGYNTDSAKQSELSHLTGGSSVVKFNYTLKPREMIPYPAAKSSILVLIVRRGHGTIIINNTRIKIKQFESYELPCGNNYAIRNDSRKDILIIDVVNV